MTPSIAAAQAPPQGSGEVATPVEIIADVVNGDVQCRPPRVRLPALYPVELRVINRAAQSLMFVAPEFFKGAEHLESAGFVYEVARGGFLAAPQSTVQVLLRTPRAGEYYYSCYDPGGIPTPQSSGFLIVVPAAR